MKLILVLAALTGASLAAVAEVPAYHRAVGVPTAERIRAAEQLADSKVAGGVPANPADFPYFAGLLISLDIGFTSVCGATLLSHTALLTAAHCWYDGQVQGTEMTVVLASARLFSGGVRVTSRQVEMHGGYRPQTLLNDIAFITIPYTEYSDAVKPVLLPSGFLLYLTFEGNQVQIVGYGVTTDSENITTEQSLRRVQAMVVNNLDCANVYGFNVVESTICTSGQGGVGPCGGDSGGPVVTRISDAVYLIGLVSFHAYAGCNIGFPGGHVRITSFVPWITARM